jgi:hypothetical protein
MMGLIAGACALGLGACATQEEIDARQAEEAELQADLARLIDEGYCTRRRETGSLTQFFYECDPDRDGTSAMGEAARESIRRMQNRGWICTGGSNCGG